MRTNITKTSMELFQSPPLKKNFLRTFLFYKFNQSVQSLHVILNRSDVRVEGCFWGSGSFSDIGAHQDFQMPELLLKELWTRLVRQDDSFPFFQIDPSHYVQLSFHWYVQQVEQTLLLQHHKQMLEQLASFAQHQKLLQSQLRLQLRSAHL